MRRLTLLAAALAAPLAALSTPANAIQQCPSVADQAAYELLSLRTQMIVLAYKCKREDEYNKNFVIRFQPALQANDRAVLAYFRRVYGGAGQGRKDQFTTELVNVMSQDANTQRTEYCSRAVHILEEMNNLRTAEELSAYAAVKDMAPTGTTMCTTAAPARTARRR